MDHRIYTREEGENAYWECGCGHSGTAGAWRVDIASDRHIPEGDRRIDVSRPGA